MNTGNLTKGGPVSRGAKGTQSNKNEYMALHDINSSKKGRKENGLVELTKKFISLLVDAPDQCLDLNKAMVVLEV